MQNQEDEIVLQRVMREHMRRVEEDALRRRIYTGLPELDKLTTGFVDGSFVVIAARPAMGKTNFALDIARSMKLSEEDVIMFFSLDMLTKRVSQWLQWKERGRCADEDTNDVALHKADSKSGCIRIEDNSMVTVEDMLKICENTKNLRAVIIDYFQLIDHPACQMGGKNRMQALNSISRELVTMARKLDVTVICTSQLPRFCDCRDDKRPVLSDLQKQGALQQDADQIIFLYRDSYYDPALNWEIPDGDILECIVAKNRYGATGTVKLRWDSKRFSFVDIQ